MSLRDCLNSAVQQGEISSREADALHAYWEARFKKKRASMGEAEAKEAARREVSEELKQKAKLKRRNANLMEARRKELLGHVAAHTTGVLGRKDPLDAVLVKMNDFGTSGSSSMKGRENAILSLALRDLDTVMARFRPRMTTGMRMNKADLKDVIRELWGQASGQPELKQMASSLKNVLEDMRQRFNAAGGNIPKREYYDVPHTHNRDGIFKAGPDEWKKFIRPLIDPDMMTNPRTGEIVGAGGIDASLDHVYESIVSDGWAHRTPEARRFGQGAMANRHADMRFLEFRSADAWMVYNDRFGDRDVISTIFGHIKTMARDIAAMETFGPNPDATLELLKQTVAIEVGKSRAGLTSVYAKLAGRDAAQYAAWRIDSMWQYLRGVPPVLSRPARFADDVRNVATSAKLGATGILAAVTDPAIAASSRALAGMPVLRGPQKMLKELAAEFANGEEGRRAAARKGILWEDYLHTMNEEARFVDQMVGHEWSRYLVDRALTLNALKPMTTARKRLEAGAWHETLGGFAEKNTDWLDLPPLMKRTMEGFGMTDADWHKMRQGVDTMGFLDPGGVLEKTGDRALAEKYAEMITQWGERAVPSNDPRIKSIITGSLPRGTVFGEIAQFASQFMSFSMSFTARQLEAISIMAMQSNTRSGRFLRGAGYFAAVSGFLMIGAGIYRQIKAVLDGKDPEDMSKPGFWVQAFIQGGGGGIFADFVASTEDRFGSGLQERLAGPGGALIADTLGLTVGNIMELFRGEKTHAGREAARLAGRYTPVLSSHPATRLWYQRHIIDNLQWMLDPDADKSFKAKKRAASYWAPPGDGLTPRRGPDFSTAVGR